MFKARKDNLELNQYNYVLTIKHETLLLFWLEFWKSSTYTSQSKLAHTIYGNFIRVKNIQFVAMSHNCNVHNALYTICIFVDFKLRLADCSKAFDGWFDLKQIKMIYLITSYVCNRVLTLLQQCSIAETTV